MSRKFFEYIKQPSQYTMVPSYNENFIRVKNSKRMSRKVKNITE